MRCIMTNFFYDELVRFLCPETGDVQKNVWAESAVVGAKNSPGESARVATSNDGG